MIQVPQKLIHKGLTLVGITIAFELIFIAVLSILLRQSYAEIQRQAESRILVSTADSLSKYLYRSVEATISYHTTHAKKFKEEYERLIPLFQTELMSLAKQASAQKNESVPAYKVVADGRHLVSLLTQAQELPTEDLSMDGFFNGKELNRKIIDGVNSLTGDLDAIVAVEKNKPVVDPHNIESKIAFFIIFGLSLNVISAVGLAFILTRSTARRLDNLMENTFRLNYNQVLLEKLKGDDEIARVDNVFHAMAENIVEANRKTRSIVENSVDVICSLDAKGRFLSANKACEVTWGYSCEELLSRFVVDIVRAADRPSMHEWLKRTISAESTATYECVIEGKDGRALNVLWSASWSKPDQALLCVVHDFTERKKYETLLQQSEERLNSLVQHMPVGAIAADETGGIKIANAVISELFGYDIEALKKKHINQLFLANDSSTELFLQCARENEESDKKYELIAIKQQGQKFPIRVTFNRIETLDGQLLLLNIIDITEEKLAEQLRKEIDAMVTHDLRSPLTSLQGFLELLELGKYGQLNEQGTKRLLMAERNVNYLIKLINDLLDVERLEAGTIQLNKAEQLPGVLIERAVESVIDLAEKLEVDIVRDMTAVKPVFVDESRMLQAVVNLLSNAIHYSPRQGKVTISATNDESHFQVKIKDEGPGIPLEHQSVIFERFKQLHNSGVEKKGSGLGLAICKAIVELHGGEVCVESEPGRGSVFSIRIPAYTQSQ